MDLLHTFYLAVVEITLPVVKADGPHLRVILNTVFGITGAIAVLIVVLAGFRFILSQGSPNEVAVARNAIIYALVGLVVIISAFAIVNFVVLQVG